MAKSDGRVLRYTIKKYFRVQFTRVPSIEFNLWTQSDNNEVFDEESDDKIHSEVEHVIFQAQNTSNQPVLFSFDSVDRPVNNIFVLVINKNFKNDTTKNSEQLLTDVANSEKRPI